MTSRPERSSPTLPPLWQRLLALSGIAFAVLLAFGWFLSGGDAPDYTATDQDWTDWADDNRSKSGAGAFLLCSQLCVAALRGNDSKRAGKGRDGRDRGCVQLARVAFAGAVVGAAGIATAIVMVGAASSEGADADPVVSRAVITASARPRTVPGLTAGSRCRRRWPRAEGPRRGWPSVRAAPTR
jgi:hypothetical protein